MRCLNRALIVHTQFPWVVPTEVTPPGGIGHEYISIHSLSIIFSIKNREGVGDDILIKTEKEKEMNYYIVSFAQIR